MTIGQFIDRIVEAAEARGLEIYRFDWTHGAFDNLRIGGRRKGTRGSGPIAILKNHDDGNWSRAEIGTSLDQIEKLLKANRF